MLGRTHVPDNVSKRTSEKERHTHAHPQMYHMIHTKKDYGQLVSPTLSKLNPTTNPSFHLPRIGSNFAKKLYSN